MSPEYNDNILSKIELNLIKEIGVLARKKIDLDFNCSLLSSPKSVDSALIRMWKKLELVKLIDSDKIIYDPLKINSAVWSGICSTDSCSTLRDYGEITIECANISAGAVAVLKSMRERLGIDIRLGYESVNAQELVKRIGETHRDSDFLVAANSPLLFTSIKEVENYQLLFPCFFLDQFVFKNKSIPMNQIKKVIIIPESSLEEHCRYFNFSNVFAGQQELVDSCELPSRLSEFDMDEMAIIWEPFASVLFKRKNDGSNSRNEISNFNLSL